MAGNAASAAAAIEVSRKRRRGMIVALLGFIGAFSAMQLPRFNIFPSQSTSLQLF
jgi:hypothetical protein